MKIVFQAYGGTPFINQAAFSLLTLLRWGGSETVLVYTDQEKWMSDFFRDFPRLKVVSVAQTQIISWRGKIDFVHRVKLEILRHAAGFDKGSVFYFDSDTIFMKNPQAMWGLVHPAQSVMHARESSLADARDPLTKKMALFCQKETFNLKRGIVSIPLATEMWNAGVIGLHESRLQLLDRALELTDVMYERYEKHVIEQLAVSYYLQSIGKIVAAEPWVMHYWLHKEIYQERIDRFISKHQDARSAIHQLEQFDFRPPQLKKEVGLFEKFLGKKS